jgi:prepilin-type N-terminal cleavage/methylation domain-containing protein
MNTWSDLSGRGIRMSCGKSLGGGAAANDRRTHHGFTLVELLVVIAIISVLAGLLLPALEQALDSSRTVSCMNNLRQLGILSQGYRDDWNDMLPPGYQTWTGSFTSWYVQLAKNGGLDARYASNRDAGPAIFQCPAAVDDASFHNWNTYTQNANADAQKLSNLKQSPSHAPYLFCKYQCGYNDVYLVGTHTTNPAKVMHGNEEYGNSLKIDGHVESIPQYPDLFAVGGIGSPRGTEHARWYFFWVQDP